MAPVTKPQANYLRSLLRSAGQAGADTLAFHGGAYTPTGQLDLTTLTKTTASRLINDLVEGNYRTPGTNTPATSPAGDRFRAAMNADKFEPTAEQRTALEMFQTGDDLLVEACAGSGKTATLKLLADADPRKRFQYVAFSRALVEEASDRFPRHVSCKTAHGLAFRTHGAPFSKRLNSPRIKSHQIAQILGVDALTVTIEVDGKPFQKQLAAGFLASHVMKALRRFCQSADPEPSLFHFGFIKGIDQPDKDGNWTFENNTTVRKYLLPFLHQAWADWQDPDGRLPYEHGGYVKAFQLSGTTINCDVLLVDEAQDLAPVLNSIVEAQTCQKILVGDSAQAIFAFTGATDAIAKSAITNRATLSQSFRFGQPIADLANHILHELKSDVHVIGNPACTSTVGPIERPACFLARTNARAVRRVLAELAGGRRPHLVGGGKVVVAFAEGAKLLQAGQPTTHPDLACFSSWGEVQLYVEDDPQGEDLKLLVKLVDEFGPDRIIEALRNMPPESVADIVISTAHVSKGRQFATVQLADDFPDGPLSAVEPEELRLLYVAVTRAQERVDVGSVGCLVDLVPDPAPAD